VGINGRRAPVGGGTDEPSKGPYGAARLKGSPGLASASGRGAPALGAARLVPPTSAIWCTPALNRANREQPLRVEVTRSTRVGRMAAICANLPFIAIAKGPEAAPKLSSPRARRLSFDPQPGSVYIISRGAAAARLVHLAFATETPNSDYCGRRDASRHRA
jgi:hypothetical protein